MPTDHAVIYSEKTISQPIGTPVLTIDSPEIELEARGESVSVPMRFVCDEPGVAILAPGLVQLLQKQNDMAFEI